MDVSPSQLYAIRCCVVLTDKNVFVTGPAGSGKSVVLDQLIVHRDKCVVVAPTGVSAANVSGVTIQSLFSIKGSPKFEDHQCVRMEVDFDTLVIDEISMLSNDVFRIVDATLRLSTGKDEIMGGVRIIVMGDFHQLPPTTDSGTLDPLYDSELWKSLNFQVCHLHKIFRNTNTAQTDLLSMMRLGKETSEVVKYLNDRLITEEEAKGPEYNEYAHLFWDKRRADKYNHHRMGLIDKTSTTFNSTISDVDFGNVKAKLELKVNARVMCIKNLHKMRVYNGECGTIISMDVGSVTVKMDNGSVHRFSPEVWMKTSNKTHTPIISQIPLQLAWGITISKSQGMTLDATVVYLRNDMHYGLAYVGMSRVKNMDNLKVVDYKSGINVFKSLNPPF